MNLVPCKRALVLSMRNVRIFRFGHGLYDRPPTAAGETATQSSKDGEKMNKSDEKRSEPRSTGRGGDGGGGDRGGWREEKQEEGKDGDNQKEATSSGR